MKILALMFALIVSGCSSGDDGDDIVIANNGNNANNLNNANNNTQVQRPNIEGTEIVDRTIYNDGELLKATPYGISFVLPAALPARSARIFSLSIKMATMKRRF